jgi:hypothetical protein
MFCFIDVLEQGRSVGYVKIWRGKGRRFHLLHWRGKKMIRIHHPSPKEDTKRGQVIYLSQKRGSGT